MGHCVYSLTWSVLAHGGVGQGDAGVAGRQLPPLGPGPSPGVDWWSAWATLPACTPGPVGHADAAYCEALRVAAALAPPGAPDAGMPQPPAADAGVPRLPFDTPELRRRLTATVLAEAVKGQEADIRWVYFNSVSKSAGEGGLKISAAYKGLGLWYRIWLYMLGDPTHAHDLLPKATDSEKQSFGPFSDLADCCQRNPWFDKEARPRAEEALRLVNEMFDGLPNPYAGWTGQGNVKDFNRNEPHWKMARAYYQLMQKDPKKYKPLVKKLKAGSNTQFMFDGIRIEAFFRGEGKALLPAEVPPYTEG